MRRLLLATAVILATTSVGHAQTETREDIALQNQILELRHDMQQLQDQVASGATTAAPAYAPPGGGVTAASSDLTPQLLSRVQTLEDQLRTLRGQVEELENQTQRMQADFTKQIGDLTFQLQQGGGQGSGAAPAASPPVTSPPPGHLSLSGSASHADRVPMPASAVPHRTPEVAMQEGNAALARHDYAAAAAAAQEVLGSGSGTRAADAAFLLGQARAGQHNDKDAAVAYDDSFNRSHHGVRAQDSLLGLAQSLYRLGEKGAACGALNKLRSAFTSLRGDIRESAAGLRGRAGCGA